MSEAFRQLAVIDDAEGIGKERIKKRLSNWDSFFERFEGKTINSIDEESDLDENFLEAYSDPKFKSIEEEHTKVRDSLLKEHGISKDELAVLRDQYDDVEHDDRSDTDTDSVTDTEGTTDTDNASDSDCDQAYAGATIHKREQGAHCSNREIISENKRDSEDPLIQQNKGEGSLLQVPVSEDEFANAQGKGRCDEDAARNCNKGCALTTCSDIQKECGTIANDSMHLAKSSSIRNNIYMISGTHEHYSNGQREEQTRKNENLTQETVVENNSNTVRFRLQGSPTLTSSFMQKGQSGKNVSWVGRNTKEQLHSNSSIECSPKSCKMKRNINETENTSICHFVKDAGLQHSPYRRLIPQMRGQNKNCLRKNCEGSQSPKDCLQEKDPLHNDDPFLHMASLVTKSKKYSPERPQSKKTHHMDPTKTDTAHLQDTMLLQDTSNKLLESKADIMDMYDQYELWKLQKRRQSGQRGSIHIVSNLDEEPTDENKYVRLSSPVLKKPVLTPRRFSLKKSVY